MSKRGRWFGVQATGLLLALIFALAGCSPAMQPEPSIEVTALVTHQVVETVEVIVTPDVLGSPTAAGEPGEQATQPPASPAPTSSAPTVLAPTTSAPTEVPFIEERLIELEWPESMRLGESDVLRLALVPSSEGYTAQTEFGEHTLDVQGLPLRQTPGYNLYGIARLDGVAFQISPSGDQRRVIPPGEQAAWRWTLAARQAGRQRLSISLTLRWEPQEATIGPVSESLAFGRGLNVQVRSLFGLSQAQALLAGMICLVVGGSLGAAALVGRSSGARQVIQTAAPNHELQVESGAHIQLSKDEDDLVRAMFNRYRRLVVEREFLSGYSGARTLLVRAVAPDGRADAATIVKIGSRAAVLQEVANYESYVKDRLPPITARIQRAPVALRGGKLAALQYTFIAEPGKLPLSLRQALSANPDPALLQKLFDTFGSHWWLQGQPYTFRMAQEYDRLLPPHWVVEPAQGKSTWQALNGSGGDYPVGEVLRLGEIASLEQRLDGRSWSLHLRAAENQPPQRLRWMAVEKPASGAVVRVTSGRMDLLREWTAGCELYGMPDPLEKLDAWLDATIQGRRATIHGDLNLENVLVGPGELVWLIDFATTREGHALQDFAHLGADLVAHVLSADAGSPEKYLRHLEAGDALLEALEGMARRCTFDPASVEEYHRALALTCLGALKYANLSPLARHCLYLTAAYYGRNFQVIG